MCHKTHNMETRYASHNTEDDSATQSSLSLDLVTQEHPMPEGDNESSDECCEKTDTHHPLAELLEQFHQLKDQFASLNSTTSQSHPQQNCYSSQITCSTSPRCSDQLPSLVRNQCTKPCRCTQTQRESNLTITMLQDIPTFDMKDSLNLEDRFMDIETTTDILTESHMCLTEARLCCLIHMLICDSTQTGKCWNEIKGILRLKICNANIHTYTSPFIEIQQKDNKTLAVSIYCFKTAAK